MGRRMDVLAWNQLAAAMITDFGRVPAKHRNYLRILFTDPAMHTLYQDWESVAMTAVAQLRMETAKYHDHSLLMALVGQLSVQDGQFARWCGSRNRVSRST